MMHQCAIGNNLHTYIAYLITHKMYRIFLNRSRCFNLYLFYTMAVSHYLCRFYAVCIFFYDVIALQADEKNCGISSTFLIPSHCKLNDLFDIFFLRFETIFTFFVDLLRLLFEGGFYSRTVSIYFMYRRFKKATNLRK